MLEFLHILKAKSSLVVNAQRTRTSGDMCEEYDPRRCTPPCNQATKCVGKKGAEAEDEACHQTPKCSRYMDNCHENLRCKGNDIRSLFWKNIPKLSKSSIHFSTRICTSSLLFLGGTLLVMVNVTSE
ncbi:hypothetical protein CK203_093000 [Vitis vinifera]|uniref:Uncharacterized protein n=1 Tax=Vitis vinifera TaxID=29760 RepID=A0A438DFQ3_VITVI|nr:hypothetical protein CK203_093000 [Vitis vinifera]